MTVPNKPLPRTALESKSKQQNKNMKTTILQLLAVTAIIATAHAAPMLNIATVISEKQADGKFHVLSSPNFTVESGKSASITSGQIELAVTPKLLDNGSVLIKSVLKTDKPTVKPQITVALDKQASMQVDDLQMTVTPSLATTH